MASDDSIEDEFGICDPCDGPAGCQSAQRCLGPSVGRVPYWHDRALAAEDRAERERLDAIVLEARAVAAEAERDKEALRRRQLYDFYEALIAEQGYKARAEAAEAEAATLRDILAGILHDLESGEWPGRGLKDMAHSALAAGREGTVKS